MGMRAGIIYRDENGISTITSVQWSTRIDQILGHFISNSDNPVEDVRNLFKKISQDFARISALQINNGETDEYRKDHSFGTVVAEGIQNADYNRTFRNLNTAMDSHLNRSSIGAIFDESKPEFISFYFENPYTDEIEVRNCSIAALGKFYNNVEKNPRKLKRFSFRNN